MDYRDGQRNLLLAGLGAPGAWPWGPRHRPPERRPEALGPGVTPSGAGCCARRRGGRDRGRTGRAAHVDRRARTLGRCRDLDPVARRRGWATQARELGISAVIAGGGAIVLLRTGPPLRRTRLVDPGQHRRRRLRGGLRAAVADPDRAPLQRLRGAARGQRAARGRARAGTRGPGRRRRGLPGGRQPPFDVAERVRRPASGPRSASCSTTPDRRCRAPGAGVGRGPRARARRALRHPARDHVRRDRDPAGPAPGQGVRREASGAAPAHAPGSPAAIPALFLAIGVVSFAINIPGNQLSRKVEASADALRAASSPTTRRR